MGEMTTDGTQKTSAEDEVCPPKPYRTVLAESAGTLTDCLKPCQALLDHLQHRAVLSEDMVSKIRCRPNRPDKVRELLSFLKNLGPQSVDALIEGLRLTDQEFLANILAAQSYT